MSLIFPILQLLYWIPAKYVVVLERNSQHYVGLKFLQLADHYGKILTVLKQGKC